MDTGDKISFVQGFLAFLVLLSMILVFFYFLTHEPAPLGAPPEVQEHSTSTPRVEEQTNHVIVGSKGARPYMDFGGVGMTYGGKMGIEIAPNLIMDFDGGLNYGFGF